MDRRLMFWTLQGIVNRERPEIYCLAEANDRQWLDWMVRKQWVKSAAVLPDNDELLRRYRSRLGGKIPFLDALFPDYAKRVSSYAEATYRTARQVPVFHATTTVRHVALAARYSESGPAPCVTVIWNIVPDNGNVIWG